ncbi:relaxase/mobilization nuclease domain-containing protein [Mucilaginibacter sp. 21P]|uniref:relaxase/mobilization nuclease domain-containing protein n=1 Tax=Mucilaginibacter sp. 21P TaxID=2778902 RepID=UPI001C5A062B|nr:relaxase/mobilization nuclease domain-containing protein [Mucilaginibacter sp. 21P]QXV66849.1 relaxase/mobilization nuclease domain-containing protein [Mucilaginibacter sp. 21P]
MVAKIRSGKSLKGALSYNEVKVADGRAELLEAVGYSKDLDDLSFRDKLFRLTDLAGRNQRVWTNTVHISLNFEVSEDLSKDRLIDIAGRYMEGIGFGAQPYLIYQHFDAGHPHIHILTTNIDREGVRISLHNLGKTRSEEARKAIEVEFGLIKAEAASQINKPKIEPVIYGQGSSKKAVEQVVRTVVNDYRFTSLPELNAILQHYHVLADRGTRSSVMYRNNGLRYWITDANGNKIGTPLKASRLLERPTLKLLEQRFQLNEALRRSDKQAVRAKVDAALSRSTSVNDLIRLLARSDVIAVIRRTDTGMIYGFTLVDHQYKVVFNGSDLGRSYAAAAIAARLTDDHSYTRQTNKEVIMPPGSPVDLKNNDSQILTTLFERVPDENTSPAFRPKKKKKRRLKL